MNEEGLLKEVADHIAKCRPGGILVSRPRYVGRDKEFEGGLDEHMVREFLESKPQSLGCDFYLNSIRSRNREDPPDCEVFDRLDNKWGFELVELVDEDFARLNCSDRPYFNPKPYSAETFTNKLQAVLEKKKRDPRSIRGAPYFKLALLVLTDEPLLSFAMCEDVLISHCFCRPEPWEMGYLLFPPLAAHSSAFQPEQMNYRSILVRFDS
jgi:hypothetical protein